MPYTPQVISYEEQPTEWCQNLEPKCLVNPNVCPADLMRILTDCLANCVHHYYVLQSVFFSHCENIVLREIMLTGSKQYRKIWHQRSKLFKSQRF